MPQVQVRAAIPDDAGTIAAIYAPYVLESAASFEEVAPDADEIGRRMLAQPRLPWLVATRSGEAVGYAYASSHRSRPGYRWAVECSVYLAAAERGRGTGRLLYEPLLAELRALGYVTAFAGVTLPNDASIHLHEAMGFEHVGVFRDVGFKSGAWWDTGWWRLPLCAPPPRPEAPRPWRPAGGVNVRTGRPA